MGQDIQEWTMQNLRKTAFKKFKVFKCCYPQILLDLFLNTLTHIRSSKDHKIRLRIPSLLMRLIFP